MLTSDGFNREVPVFNLFFIICLFFSTNCFTNEQRLKKPRLSIITSLYDGDKFVEGFLKDVTSQTIFPECELIIINANSPGNEEPVIRKYMKKHPNIIYERLDKDPGLYQCWNRAIRRAKSDFITNANLDDRSKKDSYEKHIQVIESNPSIDLIYANMYVTKEPNRTFEESRNHYLVNTPEFSVQKTYKCMAGPRPVWRKSIHERFGYFDESFKFIADWEMWVRAASMGAVFKKIPGIYTLYYHNPKGLSTDLSQKPLRILERNRIVKQYSHLWKEKPNFIKQSENKKSIQ